MKKYLYLFMVLIFISPFISAFDYDTNIYVKPFIFGVIKGEDGIIINDLQQSNFNVPTTGFFQFNQNNSPQFVSQLNYIIKDNSLLILKINDNNPKRVFKNPGINYFHIVYNSESNPDKNIFINFKFTR